MFLEIKKHPKTYCEAKFSSVLTFVYFSETLNVQNFTRADNDLGGDILYNKYKIWQFGKFCNSENGYFYYKYNSFDAYF